MPTSYMENRPIVMDIVKKLKPASVLDIGVGWGNYGVLVKKALPEVYLEGIEVWDYLNDKWRNYDRVHKADIRDFDYSTTEFDLYLMIDIIEHVSKEDGHKLIEKIPGPIIISTPLDYPQEGRENPYENHISVWTIDDFKKYNPKDYSNELSTIILIGGNHQSIDRHPGV